MAKISALIAARNEEDKIRDCLESIKDVVDEIVVIDEYSSDRTAEICREYTDKIYYREPEPIRTTELSYILGMEKSTGPWILYIDADERLSKELHDNLRKLTEQTESDAYAFLRRNYFYADGKRWVKHVDYPDFCIRLFKKDKAKFHAKPHTKPEIKGNLKYMPDNYYIIHMRPDQYSLGRLKSHQLMWAKFQAQQTIITRPRIYYFTKAFLMFFLIFGHRFIYQKGFLDGVTGLKASFMAAMYKFWTYYYVALRKQDKSG